jgi:hypothetical protein
VQTGTNALAQLEQLFGLPNTTGATSIPGVYTDGGKSYGTASTPLNDIDLGAYAASRPDLVAYWNKAGSKKPFNATSLNQFLADTITQQGQPAPLTAAAQAQLQSAQSGGLAPGASALPNLAQMLAPGAYQQSPGYQFQLGQGLEAAQNAASVAGGVGGNQLKALQNYGQGVANQDYQQWMQNQMGIYNTNVGNLFNMLGVGTDFTTQQTNALTGASNNLANYAIGTGQAQSAGIMGRANAINAGIGTAASALEGGLGSMGGGGMGGMMGGARQANPAGTGSAIYGSQQPSFIGGNPWSGMGQLSY